MREKVRNLPIGKCYISPSNWQEAGMAHAVVSRVRPNGNVAMASFLVDTFCLGVKDARYNDNMTANKFEQYLDKYNAAMGLEEISYNEVHNIIYGAIEFAEEGGIQPVKGFNLAQYILEKDTDEIPLMEYEYGKNGKHFLIVHPDENGMPYINTLKKNLGDNFEFVLPYGEVYDDDYEDDMSESHGDRILEALESMKGSYAESARHPKEKYSYQHPAYPEEISVRNQFIADELLSPDNYDYLSRDVIDRILALPHDEVAQDLSNIVMYVIGKTYKAINDDTIGEPTDSAILHALILLARTPSEKGMDAILEIMRQNGEFADYHLGDMAPELIYPALYACGRNNLKAIEDYMNQPGLDSYLRAQAADALAMMIVRHPERRSEIIEVLRRLLCSMVSRLPKQDACDGSFAGFVMCDLVDILATELLPEIKAVFATDCVDQTISGDCQSVIRDIESGRILLSDDKYEIPDIYEQYASLKKWLDKSRLSVASDSD